MVIFVLFLNLNVYHRSLFTKVAVRAKFHRNKELRKHRCKCIKPYTSVSDPG